MTRCDWSEVGFQTVVKGVEESIGILSKRYGEKGPESMVVGVQGCGWSAAKTSNEGLITLATDSEVSITRVLQKKKVSIAVLLKC